MMRAVVDRVESRRFMLKMARESIVNLVNQFFREIAARDSRLVRYHDRQPAGIIQNPDRLGGIRKQLKPRWMIDVPHLFRNCAIAIDEDCWTFHEPHATESQTLLTVLAKLLRLSSACERSNTSSTVIAVIQR